MKNLTLWTRKEFKALPSRKWDEEVVFDSMVILPTRRIHNSGYRCLDFVAVRNYSEPFCLLSGYSDVIHINGIGGFGKDWYSKFGKVPDSVKPIEWSIDCLKTSGLLHIFCRKQLTCGPALSSFELFINDTEEATP